MSVGSAVAKIDVDYRSDQLARVLRDNFDSIKHFKIWLDTQTDPMLTALGYDSGDIAVLRSGVGDMEQLRLIYEGLANLTNAKDFRTFTKRLTGVS